MTEYKTIKDLGDLDGKVAMLRADLNVPMDENFHVTNTARIDRTVPTIKMLMDKGAKVVVISHFGRPEGKGDMKNSLSHVAPELEKALGKHVVFVDDCIGSKVEEAVKNMKSDEILLLENLRFYNEEKKGDEAFAAELVKPADVYVSDAFSTAHRAHASMVAAAKLKPAAFGLLMEEEVNALSKGLNNPERPLMAVVGGSKVSTKLDLLNNLVKKVDKLVISGGMAHTFMKASGIDTVNEANSFSDRFNSSNASKPAPVKSFNLFLEASNSFKLFAPSTFKVASSPLFVKDKDFTERIKLLAASPATKEETLPFKVNVISPHELDGSGTSLAISNDVGASVFVVNL